MTNADKFKTAEERAREYQKYCSSSGMGCNKCPLKKVPSIRCPFEWLNLEYEEGLKPCPFCGGEATVSQDVNYDWWYVECSNDNCAVDVATKICETKDEAISIWNRRAK